MMMIRSLILASALLAATSLRPRWRRPVELADHRRPGAARQCPGPGDIVRIGDLIDNAGTGSPDRDLSARRISAPPARCRWPR